MRSLIVFIVFLGGVTFYFANNVIPASQQKFFNLRRNIAKVKPAAAIEEGVFSDFEGMSIKVDNKYGEKDRFLENVTIHQKNNTNENKTVIKAKTGELVSSETSELIQLVLRDGHYYEDVTVKSADTKRKYPFAEANFEIYRMNIEIPAMEQDLEEDSNIDTDKMKNASRLIKDIDSLKRDNIRIVNAFSKNITNRLGAFAPKAPVDSTALNSPESTQLEDSLKLEIRAPELKIPSRLMDTLKNPVDLFQDWQKIQVVATAKNSTSSILASVQGKKEELDRRYKIYRMHILSLHKKYALALSCILLFFVGAPLGAIIRKGGLGLPMVIAIILFLIYYFIGVFAGNYAKEGNISPILGAWLSTLIMLPLGVILTRRATADKGLMSFGSIVDRIKEIFKKKDKIVTI